MATKISISLHDSLLESIEHYMQEKGLLNRSEAIMSLIQKGLIAYWYGKDKEQKVIHNDNN